MNTHGGAALSSAWRVLSKPGHPSPSSPGRPPLEATCTAAARGLREAPPPHHHTAQASVAMSLLDMLGGLVYLFATLTLIWLCRRLSQEVGAHTLLASPC